MIGFEPTTPSSRTLCSNGQPLIIQRFSRRSIVSVAVCSRGFCPVSVPPMLPRLLADNRDGGDHKCAQATRRSSRDRPQLPTPVPACIIQVAAVCLSRWGGVIAYSFVTPEAFTAAAKPLRADRIGLPRRLQRAANDQVALCTWVNDNPAPSLVREACENIRRNLPHEKSPTASIIRDSVLAFVVPDRREGLR